MTVNEPRGLSCGNQDGRHPPRASGNSLFTVPFTASTTNAMEMNRAMTSSVDLGNHRSLTEVTVTVAVVYVALYTGIKC